MLDETFYIDGVDMRTLGVYLQQPIEVSGLVRDVETVSIEGRNGDLIFDKGRFLNRKGKAVCYALSPTGDITSAMTAINAVLLNGFGYREIKQSEDPAHFWKARITNGADIMYRMAHLNPFTIEFDIEPEHWAVDGKKKVGLLVNEKNEVQNSHSGVAKPIIILSVSAGKVVLSVNDNSVILRNVTAFSPLVLDSATGNAYYEDGKNVNSHVEGDILALNLKQGKNLITYSQIDGTIYYTNYIPRWWDL